MQENDIYAGLSSEEIIDKKIETGDDLVSLSDVVDFEILDAEYIEETPKKPINKVFFDQSFSNEIVEEPVINNIKDDEVDVQENDNSYDFFKKFDDIYDEMKNAIDSQTSNNEFKEEIINIADADINISSHQEETPFTHYKESVSTEDNSSTTSNYQQNDDVFAEKAVELEDTLSDKSEYLVYDNLECKYIETLNQYETITSKELKESTSINPFGFNNSFENSNRYEEIVKEDEVIEDNIKSKENIEEEANPTVENTSSIPYIIENPCVDIELEESTVDENKSVIDIIKETLNIVHQNDVNTSKIDVIVEEQPIQEEETIENQQTFENEIEDSNDTNILEETPLTEEVLVENDVPVEDEIPEEVIESKKNITSESIRNQFEEMMRGFDGIFENNVEIKEEKPKESHKSNLNDLFDKAESIYDEINSLLMNIENKVHKQKDIPNEIKNTSLSDLDVLKDSTIPSFLK